MPRTTLDLDGEVLDELRRRGERDRKSMGQLASELLAPVLAEPLGTSSPPPMLWRSGELGMPKVPLEDKEALRRALDQ